MSLTIGERIYCLEQDIKDYVHRNNLEQDKDLDFIIQQCEELHEIYNGIQLSDTIDILEVQRFYKDYCKTHNLYDLAQEIGISETSLRKIAYGYQVGDKVLKKCWYYAKNLMEKEWD